MYIFTASKRARKASESAALEGACRCKETTDGRSIVHTAKTHPEEKQGSLQMASIVRSSVTGIEAAGLLSNLCKFCVCMSFWLD